MMQCNYV